MTGSKASKPYFLRRAPPPLPRHCATTAWCRCCSTPAWRLGRRRPGAGGAAGAERGVSGGGRPSPATCADYGLPAHPPAERRGPVLGRTAVAAMRQPGLRGGAVRFPRHHRAGRAHQPTRHPRLPAQHPGAGVCSATTQHLPHIAHVQIAGVPDRYEPDRDKLHYSYCCTGWVGCEYRLRAGTLKGLYWKAQYRPC